MANRLSDEELRKSLQDYGQEVGPITPTTRSLWERKLMSLSKVNGPSPSTRALNAFSSDDSEIESAKTYRARKKRTSTSRNESTKNHDKLGISRSRGTPSSSPDSDTFKKPSPVHIPLSGKDKKYFSSRSSLHRDQNIATKRVGVGKNSTFDVETSDSDFDSETSLMPAKTLRLRKKSPALNIGSDFQGVNYRRQNPDFSNFEISMRRKCLSSNADSKQSVLHFSSTLDRLKKEHLDPGYQTNGYLSNTISNGEFHEEKVQGSSTNYSHCVSWMLVIGTVAFFIIIGALYMTEVQKTSQSTNKSYSKFCDGVEEEECKLLIRISRDLHQLLTTRAGEYDCDTTGLVKNRSLPVPDARSLLWEQISVEKKYKKEKFKKIFRDSVGLLLKNPDWGIKYFSPLDNKSEAFSQSLAEFDSSALEALVAAKPFWCRIKLSLQWTATTIFTICLGGVLLFMSYCGVKLWKKRREVQEKLFYELVERVIDILQDQQDSSYQSDSNLGPYKVVVNIRDTLIPPKDRKAKLWLWEKVVAFIEENESRVSVEYKTIAGEDFKVWRWNPSTTAEVNEGGKQGKVWQGQAFNSLGKGKTATYCPTPCLKIRNMFDSEMEYGDDWRVSIQDAILEKCEGNDGILHIAFDTSSNESCVYMLCSSSEAAGKAFNALHGWWFDNLLVTVKYIRYERYLERFPEAENCKTPLRPSNNKRLSLSTPFFSSALERS